MNDKDSAKRIALLPAMNCEPARLETINTPLDLDNTALESCIGGQLIVPGPPVAGPGPINSKPLYPNPAQQAVTVLLGAITGNVLLVGLALANPSIPSVPKETGP
jgi:hypothetical protein